MATGGENPARVYINLSTSANGSSVFAALDPTASYRESRSQPIVADISQYKFGVVRVNLTGNRNFPLLIPDIKAGQPNPWLTNYQMTLSLTCKNLGAFTINTVPPVAAAPKYFGIRTFVNNVLQNEDMVYCYDLPGPALNTAAAVAASLQAQIQAGGTLRGDEVLKSLTVTAGVDSRLTFYSDKIATNPDYYSWSFTVEPGADGSMQYFGFLNTFPQSGLVNNFEGSTTLPYPCSYTITPGTPGSGVLSCTQNMMWETQEPFQPTPPPPIPAPQPSQAYWLYDYSWFVRLFQKQINAIWSGPTFDGSPSLIQQATARGYEIASFPPTVSYDVDKRKFVLTVNKNIVGTTFDGNELLTVTLNETFANLLAWGGGTYDINGSATLGFQNANYSKAESEGLVLFTSEYTATGNGWSPVGAILFTTGLFPTRAEIVSAPHVQGADGLIGGFNSTADTSQVISDVINPASDASDYNAFPIIYVPTLIRWCDMPSGRRLLDIIDFKLKWRNGITNEEYDIYLNPGSFFSAKVILQRRDISDA